MFKFTNPKIDSLLQRIKDLELLNERMLGETNQLLEQLRDAKDQASLFQNKLFDVVGLNKRSEVSEGRSEAKQPIGNKVLSWASQRQKLEQEASIKYYERKNAETEAQRIAALEKDLQIGNSDAS